MNPGDLILEWLIWHQAVEYIKADVAKVEATQTRLPYHATFAADILRYIGSRAFRKEQEAAKVMRANGVRFVKEKFDRGELLVAWSHRGNTDIYRIGERKLRLEVQKKIDEIMVKMIETKQGEPPRE